MMDDAHAHPLSPANTTHTRPRSSTVLNLREPQPIPTHTTPKSLPHTRQQRLLHTRHSRFPAQRISINGMTIPFPHLIRSIDNETSYTSGPRSTNREEDGVDIDNPAEVISPSPNRSSILTELTNSGAYHARGMNKRAPIPIFQDSPTRFAKTTETNSPSVYHDASGDVQSPSVTDSIRGSSASMGLREVSINLHRPSPNKDSPQFRSVRVGTRRISSHSKPRFNSEEYIDHIENELQLVKDAMYSPTTNVPWKEKLRKAKDENERLKKEMEMMRSSFELEMHQTVEQSTGIELRLKRRIKDLEDEVEHKQTVILNLEHDRKESGLDQNTLEVLKAKLEKLEEEKSSLEITNRDMMKRNEVLTQLLALSPTKTQHNFELPTPRRRSARPMSMIIPRMPSPGTQTPRSRPQSVLISPALPASDCFPTSGASSPLASSPSGLVNNFSTAADDVQSIASGTEDSSSQLTEETCSRRSTLASCVANSPPMPPSDHPPPEIRPQMPLRQPSKRRPRKFMPGSTQLKPLLLPTFTAENGNLPLTSPVTSPNRPPSTIADYGLSYMAQWETPPISRRRVDSQVDSLSVASSQDTTDQATHAYQSLSEVFTVDRASYCKDTLKALSNGRRDQGRPHSPLLQYYTSNEPCPEAATDLVNNTESLPLLGSWDLGTTPVSPLDVHWPCNENENDKPIDQSDKPNRSRLSQILSTLDTSQIPPEPERGLETPEEHVEVPRPLFSQDLALDRGATQSPVQFSDDLSPLNPRKRRKASSASGNSEQVKEPSARGISTCEDPRPTLTPSSIIKRTPECASSRPAATSSSRRQDINRSRSPLQILQQRNVGARPLATLTIQTVYATLSRYTTYIRNFKRDPLALARRVIANAWRSNWAVFGRLSWWVLGLFIGRQGPSPKQRAWNWESYDGESIANRYCGFEHGQVSPNEGGLSPGREAANPAPDHVGSTTKANTMPSDTWVPPHEDPKPGWGKSLFLWGKFSVAIMLAVGGAIVKGPAEMLRETEERRRSRSSSLSGIETGEQSPTVQEIGGQSNGSEQVLCSETSQRSEEIRTQRTARKARSFSSPTPPWRPHQLQSFHLDEGPPSSESNTEKAHVAPDGPSTEAGDSTSSTIATLKPSRTERGGLELLFDPSCSENRRCGTIGETPTLIEVPTDCEDGATAENLSENGQCPTPTSTDSYGNGLLEQLPTIGTASETMMELYD